ncbi:alpha-ketoglutarate-dependent dioxygenase AlkB family protein [Faecalibacter rhinopitheci]|uniref:Alpha-ketoglutarate-dependent dioxygenase AlkB n=1 Tax=Faecalibacter rhinopitheci TaxID=2779678 RepID=A0A8J7G3P1_9FLAO|nr:alpha-ketoglutarate-dependent dioxygenase AlkB [Faecalibacter rhinopitheci]MBF0596117.1 alpha-ketoglutarate-dependent dioxygenase AlkB [Faecalibacter rhinopitheci]
MELFNDLYDVEKNLLPYDGMVNYHGPILNELDALAFFKILCTEIEWQNDLLIIFGKKIETKRKVAWYGDKAFPYTYSKITKHALAWNSVLLSLKTLVEKESKETYNSCLLNLYHDGTEQMSWHSDNEEQLKKHGAIASLSFGAARRFVFKHKETKETVQLTLADGSLLVMKDETQDFWLHRLPAMKIVSHPRINLTFRTIQI